MYESIYRDVESSNNLYLIFLLRTYADWLGNELMIDECKVTPMQKWKNGGDTIITIKSSGKKKRIKSIDEILEEVQRKDRELRASKEAIPVDPNKPIAIIQNGDGTGFPKKHDFGELQDALEALHDARHGIKRKEWVI